jgi:hypothetical protein
MQSLDPVHRFYWEGQVRRGWREPRRRIYDCELVYVARGRIAVAFDRTRRRVIAPAVTIVPPATWHESWATHPDGAMRYCVHFDWTRDHASSRRR